MRLPPANIRFDNQLVRLLPRRNVSVSLANVTGIIAKTAPHAITTLNTITPPAGWATQKAGSRTKRRRSVTAATARRSKESRTSFELLQTPDRQFHLQSQLTTHRSLMKSSTVILRFLEVRYSITRSLRTPREPSGSCWLRPSTRQFPRTHKVSMVPALPLCSFLKVTIRPY